MTPVATREPWMQNANCRGVDTGLFFPHDHESRLVVADAKAVCRACEVRSECLDYALANGEIYGVWGGYAPKERRRLRRERGVTAPAPRREHGTRNGYPQHYLHGEKPCRLCVDAYSRYTEFNPSRARAVTG